MCLAIPGEVVARYDDRGTPMATVAFGPVTKAACVSLVPEVDVGGWVIVHAGVAIAELDEDAAAETIRLMSAMLDDDPHEPRRP